MHSTAQWLYNKWNVKCDVMKDYVSVLKEMIDIRDEFKQCSILSQDNINWFAMPVQAFITTDMLFSESPPMTYLYHLISL